MITIIVVLTAVLSGCKTAYIDEPGRRFVGSRGQPGLVIPLPGQADPIHSSNYRYSADVAKKELDRIMVTMEEFHQRLMTARFGKSKWPAFEKFNYVVIVKDAARFARKVASAADAIMDGESAVVIPSAKEIVLLHQESEGEKGLFAKLFRAQARLFFHRFAPELPLWLHEGMVSYFEEVEIGGIRGAGSLRIVGQSARKLTKAKELLEAGKLPGLTELTAIEKREDLTDAAGVAVWAFVHWSQTSPKNRAMLGRYLDAIEQEGRDKVKIKDYLSMKLADFDKYWETWLVREAAKLRKRTQRASGGRKK